jgi:hypothetical protein
MSLRTPELRDQQLLMSEIMAQRVESGPHAARFFLYLVEMLDLSLYKKWYIGTPPYSRPTLVDSQNKHMRKGQKLSNCII